MNARNPDSGFRLLRFRGRKREVRVMRDSVTFGVPKVTVLRICYSSINEADSVRVGGLFDAIAPDSRPD
jgi:hypothetical protein